MAKRSPHSFKKWEKENKRKRKALEKMARRQGKKDEVNGEDNPAPAVKDNGEDNPDPAVKDNGE
ncbi:MAG: hypothetical protein JRJ47_04380 [Deltaproteobacteria bacterium]|nr:hypothetical protein [Deltaproteobacteria bacterium]